MNSSIENRLWGVVLAGGIGSRFWPASTPSRPKQLLRLGSDKPLIVDTIERVEDLIPRDRLKVLTGSHLTGPISSVFPDFGDDNFFVEPRAAGTAPVLIWAAWLLLQRDPDAVMISLHADHVINPAATFRDQLLRAAQLAEEHHMLFTLGIVPDRPETGYGYIKRANALDGDGEDVGYRVDRFVEKPDLATAQQYLDSGEYLWNTGIFIWRADDLLAQVREHTPEIAELLPLLDAGRTEEFFAQVPSLSIDEGVLERSGSVGVLPARFRWDDIGAWDAVYRTQPLDENGNAVVGEAHLLDTEGSVLFADDGPIVAFGVRDLIVVRTGGVTFVTHRDRTADLKKVLAKLPEGLRTLE